MMLCDENAINFIYWEHERENIDIPFEGKARDLYFFDDNNEIIYIPNNIIQAKYKDDLSYQEEMKDKFAEYERRLFIVYFNLNLFTILSFSCQSSLTFTQTFKFTFSSSIFSTSCLLAVEIFFNI